LEQKEVVSSLAVPQSGQKTCFGAGAATDVSTAGGWSTGGWSTGVSTAGSWSMGVSTTGGWATGGWATGGWATGLPQLEQNEDVPSLAVPQFGQKTCFGGDAATGLDTA
jgi:hypothetical protein